MGNLTLASMKIYFINEVYLGSISSRCSGNEPALGKERRPDTRERRKSSLKFTVRTQICNQGVDEKSLMDSL